MEMPLITLGIHSAEHFQSCHTHFLIHCQWVPISINLLNSLQIIDETTTCQTQGLFSALTRWHLSVTNSYLLKNFPLYLINPGFHGPLSSLVVLSTVFFFPASCLNVDHPQGSSLAFYFSRNGQTSLGVYFLQYISYTGWWLPNLSLIIQMISWTLGIYF